MGKKLFGNSSSGGRFSDPRPGASGTARPVSPSAARPAAPSGGRSTAQPRPQAERRPEPRRETEAAPKKTGKRKGRKVAIVLLSVLLALEVLYCVAVFSNIPGIKRLRDMYIQTAMTTKSHHWLATAFIPYDIVKDVMNDYKAARESQMGITSNWGTEPTAATEPTMDQASVKPVVTTPTTEPENREEEAFYKLFPEIDRVSFEAYLKEHPGTLDNGGLGRGRHHH